MARRRDYRAEYAARKAKAQQIGYSGYRQQRVKRAEGKPLAGDVSGQRQIIRLAGDSVLVRSTKRGRGLAVIESQVQRAADAGQYATGTVTVSTDAGPRQVNLWGRGGWDAGRLADFIDAYGSVDLAIVALIAELYAGEGWADDLTTGDLLDVQIQFG